MLTNIHQAYGRECRRREEDLALDRFLQFHRAQQQQRKQLKQLQQQQQPSARTAARRHWPPKNPSWNGHGTTATLTATTTTNTTTTSDAPAPPRSSSSSTSSSLLAPTVSHRSNHHQRSLPALGAPPTAPTAPTALPTNSAAAASSISTRHRYQLPSVRRSGNKEANDDIFEFELLQVFLRERRRSRL